MAKRTDVFKCELCGNIVEMYEAGGGTLVCCGEDMILLDEKSADMTTEKHVPMIEKIVGGYKVTVGSTLHPMDEKHYIQWIELITDENEVLTAYLKPGQVPSAVFKTTSKKVTAREYCNLHGLWKNEA
jgi:superoxide reductase